MMKYNDVEDDDKDEDKEMVTKMTTPILIKWILLIDLSSYKANSNTGSL